MIKGTAHLRYRHITTGERYELVTKGGEARIVETVPGWNAQHYQSGDDEMIVMLWANEIFDRKNRIRLLAPCDDMIRSLRFSAFDHRFAFVYAGCFVEGASRVS